MEPVQLVKAPAFPDQPAFPLLDYCATCGAEVRVLFGGASAQFPGVPYYKCRTGHSGRDFWRPEPFKRPSLSASSSSASLSSSSQPQPIIDPTLLELLIPPASTAPAASIPPSTPAPEPSGDTCAYCSSKRFSGKCSNKACKPCCIKRGGCTEVKTHKVEYQPTPPSTALPPASEPASTPPITPTYPTQTSSRNPFQSTQLEKDVTAHRLQELRKKELARAEQAQRVVNERRALQTVKVHAWVEEGEVSVTHELQDFPFPHLEFNAALKARLGLNATLPFAIYRIPGPGHWSIADENWVWHVEHSHRHLLVRNVGVRTMPDLDDILHLAKARAPHLRLNLPGERSAMRGSLKISSHNGNELIDLTSSDTSSCGSPLLSPALSSPTSSTTQSISPSPALQTRRKREDSGPHGLGAARAAARPRLTSPSSPTSPTPPSPSAEPIELSDNEQPTSGVRKWPAQYSVAEVSRHFEEVESAPSKRKGVRFQHVVPGVTYVRSTYNVNQRRWSKCSNELQQSWIKRGSAGLWSEFLKYAPKLKD